jgi:small-conductance mechanosensitive channel/CRP-like cAMP-binding protein
MEHVVGVLSGASSGSIGVSIAIALLVVAFLLFDAKGRRSLRQPFYFLTAHFCFKGVELLLEKGSPLWRAMSLLALTMLLAAIGRAGVILVIDAVLGRRLRRQLPKIIRDILQGVVYFVLLLGVLRQLGLEPGQLLTTSALLTAVIGLSLQETLGNLIAGLAIQVQQPFAVGDWIQFDGEPRHIGKVQEINWRATTLVTLDEVEIIVPNGFLAKAPLKNFTRPTDVVRRSLYVHASYEVPPRRVEAIVLGALRDCPGVLTEPPPTVVTNAFAESGVEYWVRVFTREFHRRDIIDGSVRDRIWYGFQRAGIGIPYPHRIVHMQHHSDESRAQEADLRIAKRERALTRVGFLAVIDDAQRRELAERAALRLFSPGEVIVRQGDQGDELYIVLRGEVSVVLDGPTTPVEVSRLGAGEFFGEMALVTGEARTATVRAVAECELLVIDHDAFERVLQARPELVEQLSLVLTQRQLELDGHAARSSDAERTSRMARESSQLIGRIKRFFSLD